MLATPVKTLGLINGIPAQQILAGLTTLHQSVIVTDTDGTVRWASRAIERVLAGSDRSFKLDLSLAPNLATLCDHYLETRDDAASASGHASTLQDPRPAPERATLLNYLREILDQLQQHGSLCDYRIEASWLEGVESEIELNAFRVDSHVSESAGATSTPNVPLYVMIMRPVPRREKRDTSLGDLGAFYKSVLDQLPEATLTIDRAGFITYANQRVESLLGRSRRELIDRPISLVLPSSAILPINESLDAEFDAIERDGVELSLRGGSETLVEIVSRKLDRADGKNLGRIIQLRDTTRQLRVTKRFKQKIASLESYVHKVAHDLRSPLVSLLGFTRLMRQDYEMILDESGMRFLNRIEQAGSNINTMTRDLLEESMGQAPDRKVLFDDRDLANR